MLLDRLQTILRKKSPRDQCKHKDFLMFYFLISSYCDASLIVHCLWPSFVGESRRLYSSLLGRETTLCKTPHFQ